MLVLEANYSKKIGLPGYSSHQFSITLRTEITDVNQVQVESARLYKLLQEGVDTSIQEIGYLPANGKSENGNGQKIGTGQDRWQCSDKQRNLILKITDEHKLDKNQVEQLANDRFGKGVKQLNKLEASGLIEELLEQTGQKQNGRNRFSQKVGAR